MIQLILFIAKVFSRVIEVYSLLMVAYAMLSWFPGAYQTRIGQWIIRLADPYVSIFRRFNLRFAGLDFSVMAAIISLQVIESFGLRILGLMLRIFV